MHLGTEKGARNNLESNFNFISSQDGPGALFMDLLHLVTSEEAPGAGGEKL